MHWRYRLRGFKDCRSQKQQDIYQPFRTGEPLETSSRSIWLIRIRACNMAAKKFWPIPSISFPGLMQDRQQSKRCAVKCGKDWSLRSILHRSLPWLQKGSGVMDNHCQFLTEKLTRWQLFQLKILRARSLLCSWTNGIITFLSIYIVETLPRPWKSWKVSCLQVK